MSSQHRRPFTRSRRIFAATAAVAVAGMLAACSGGTGEVNEDYGFAIAEQVEGSPITIWADATRQPAVEAFQAAHPDIEVDLVIDDGSASGSATFQTKIALADQAGEGWPDVVFSTQNNDASWASKEANGVQAFAAPLNKGYFDEDFLDGFTSGALDPLTVDDTVWGLRNDLAPVLFWYNQQLMDEFGYEVPTTWEEYEALGERLATEHPGYFLGSVGDSFVGPYVYYWAGAAPIFQVDGNTFSSDVNAPNSVRVTEMLDTMVANGSLIQDSVFSAEFVAKSANLLAIPGPAWYAGALFQNPDSVNAAEGQWGTAEPLYWEGDEKVTGNVGGGTWFASSHSQNLEAVKTFLEYIVSDPEVAGTGGLPAYQSAADTWVADQASSGFFSGDFETSINTAASSVWSGWGFPNFSAETSYSKIVVPALAAGQSIADVADAWQTEMENEATVVGYTVQ
ncbi:multiple sugar transport system substrate-binding protein [Microbacteriaceae bacterium SG_E_30_P1]|uniref:Multiple sugar transport system substrate-binding protein n=1 Tax=Antiquaquibacter oligotrophicus TaxID=2880260 RepID=A0ABT6KK15_9MICO|nr:extracellular solute-binding protein [Antiquaquibacter oligotrophicus]MDH6180169.1 multiple sugar transport system substrate-binding protein [Antiquaquibacter oligotrophicus]UDF14079.1 extracellular solute-binding protein [Antiquaquibacter oligotrophicus]